MMIALLAPLLICEHADPVCLAALATVFPRPLPCASIIRSQRFRRCLFKPPEWIDLRTRAPNRVPPANCRESSRAVRVEGVAIFTLGLRIAEATRIDCHRPQSYT